MTALVIGLGIGLFTLALLFVLALCHAAATPTPLVWDHVTPLDAKRKLLEKAQREYRFRANWGRER